MRIAIASGKGGTGKTTIATSLALSLSPEHSLWYLDCDVEAPNGHLFLNPQFEQHQPAEILIPQIQKDTCTLCGKCVEVCQFHALAKIGQTILVFPQLCHGCGSCSLNCPENAIIEIPNPIGTLDIGTARQGIRFLQGVLTISEPMPTPMIRQLKRLNQAPQDAVVIYDAPPGASCSVVETLRGSDFVLLVTEPTPFGLHDLKQMLGIVAEMNIPAGVVINRDGIGDHHMEDFLAEQGLPVLLRIPFDKTIAAGIAAGKTLVDIDPAYRIQLQSLHAQIVDLVKMRRPC